MTDTYDDGLVHSHNWASESQPPSAGAKPQPAEIARPVSAHPDEDQIFDEGLVHGHEWART